MRNSGASAGSGEGAVDPVDDERVRRFVRLHPHSERLERPVHVARVVRGQGSCDLGAVLSLGAAQANREGTKVAARALGLQLEVFVERNS